MSAMSDMSIDVWTDPRFATISGTPYVVLAGDTRLTPRAVESGTLIDPELAALPEIQALGGFDTVLDIGAFVGDTTLLFLQKGCRVWAFEPYGDAFAALRHNCPAAHCLNVPVGDDRRVQAGDLGEEGNLGTRMVTKCEWGMATVRIDDLSLVPTFVKIDVEGFEIPVLDGMRRTIERHQPTILIEVYDTLLAKQGYTRQDVLLRLDALGYVWRVAIGREEDDRLDYLAVHKSRAVGPGASYVECATIAADVFTHSLT